MRVLLLFLWVFGSTPGRGAGLFASVSMGTGSFSFRAQDAQPTPNYLGFSPKLQLGIDVSQVVEVSVFGSYTAAGYKKFITFSEHAALAFYGMQIAGIIEDVFFGCQGGPVRYHLFKISDEVNEFAGRWDGWGGGLFLGARLRSGKTDFFQISFDYNQFLVRAYDKSLDKDDRPQRIDQAMITMSYVFQELVSFFKADSVFDSVF